MSGNWTKDSWRKLEIKQQPTYPDQKLLSKTEEELSNFPPLVSFDEIENLKSQNLKILIFEPLLDKSEFNGIPVEKDFNTFTKKIDLIIANRLDESIMNFKNIIFTRDIYKRD